VLKHAGEGCEEAAERWLTNVLGVDLQLVVAKSDYSYREFRDFGDDSNDLLRNYPMKSHYRKHKISFEVVLSDASSSDMNQSTNEPIYQSAGASKIGLPGCLPFAAREPASTFAAEFRGQIQVGITKTDSGQYSEGYHHDQKSPTGYYEKKSVNGVPIRKEADNNTNTNYTNIKPHNSHNEVLPDRENSPNSGSKKLKSLRTMRTRADVDGISNTIGNTIGSTRSVGTVQGTRFAGHAEAADRSASFAQARESRESSSGTASVNNAANAASTESSKQNPPNVQNQSSKQNPKRLPLLQHQQHQTESQAKQNTNLAHAKLASSSSSILSPVRSPVASVGGSLHFYTWYRSSTLDAFLTAAAEARRVTKSSSYKSSSSKERAQEVDLQKTLDTVFEEHVFKEGYYIQLYTMLGPEVVASLTE
jgi:hypothetical protein